MMPNAPLTVPVKNKIANVTASNILITLSVVPMLVFIIEQMYSRTLNSCATKVA